MHISQGLVILLQMWHEQTHASEDRQPHGEAALAEAQSMQCGCTEDIAVGDAIGTQTRYGFGHEEGIAFLHALAQVAQKLFATAAHIAFHGRWANPDFAIANL